MKIDKGNDERFYILTALNCWTEKSYCGCIDPEHKILPN